MAALIAYVQQLGSYNYILEDPDPTKNRIYIENQALDVRTLVPRVNDTFFAQVNKEHGTAPTPSDSSGNFYDYPVVITRGKHGMTWSDARQSWYGRIGMLDPWLLTLDYSIDPSPSRLQWVPEEKHVFMFYLRGGSVTQDIWTGLDMNGPSTYRVTGQGDYNLNFYQGAYGEYVGFNVDPSTTAITLMKMQPWTTTQTTIRTHTNGQMFFITYDKNSKTGFFVEVAGSTSDYILVSMEDHSVMQGTSVYTGNATTMATFTAPGVKDLIEQFPSNLKSSTTTRKVFYTGHYGVGHTPGPQRIVIDTAINLVTANSCTMLTPSAPSHSYKFDGQDDNIAITHNAGLPLGTNNFTFEFWFTLNVSSILTNRSIVTLMGSGSGFAAFRIELNNGFVRWLISLNGTSHAADWQGVTRINPGTWHHAMFTRLGTTYSIYLDGILDFTTTFGTGASSLSAGTTHRIGSLDNNTAFFFGAISNMRLINGQSIVTGTTVGTRAFTPSTSQLTSSTLGHTGVGVAVSLTGAVTLLTCQNTTLVSNGTLSLTFTAAGAAAGSIAAPAQGINPFNSHSQLAPTWTSGAYSNGGQNTWWIKPHVFRHNEIDYITFCTQDKSCFNFTFERWISPDQRTWTTWSIGQGTDDDQLTYHSKIVWGQDSINAYEMVRSWVPTNEEGTRMVVFQNNKLSTITFNATQGWVQSNVQNYSVRSYGIDITGRMYIVTRGLASPQKSAGNADIWLGGMGYGAIYTYDPLITSDEVIIEKAQNYEQFNGTVINTTCTVYATSSRPLHFKGDVRASPIGPFGPPGTSWATNFTGSPMVVYGANSSDFAFGRGDFTVEFWLYSNVAWSAQSDLAGIVGQRLGDATNGWHIGQFSGAVGGANRMWTRFNSNSWLGHLDFPSTLDVGNQVWEHWALVRKDGIMYWYKNGVACGQVANPAEINDVGGQFVVGWAETWDRFLNARISNLRICKGLAVYNGAFTPPTANFSVTQLANPFGGSNTNAITEGQCVFLGFQTADVTLDSARLYVAETVTLRIEGSNMTFDNESNLKTVTTSAAGPITVPLRIVGPGVCSISYTKN
jgi:hypothetical protein